MPRTKRKEAPLLGAWIQKEIEGSRALLAGKSRADLLRIDKPAPMKLHSSPIKVRGGLRPMSSRERKNLRELEGLMA